MYNNRIDSVAVSAVPGRMDPGSAAEKNVKGTVIKIRPPSRVCHTHAKTFTTVPVAILQIFRYPRLAKTVSRRIILSAWILSARDREEEQHA